MKELKVFELFAGIGSQAMALKNIKIPHNVVSISEWDVHSLISYGAIHKNKEIELWIDKNKKINKEDIVNKLNKYGLSLDGKSLLRKFNGNFSTEKLLRILGSCIILNNLGNISNIKEKNIPDHDLLTYSFPCQDLSLQGKRKGLKKGTRSGLLWDVEKLLFKLKNKERLPKYLLMENVPAIFNKIHSEMFTEWKKSLSKMGYINAENLLNGKFFGVPQNRNRAFMVSILNDDRNIDLNNYDKKITKSINDILDKKNDNYKIVSSKGKELLISINVPNYNLAKENSFGIISSKIENYTNFSSESRLFHPKGITGTLTATGAQSRLKFPWEEKDRIRLITSKESWRLMGFTDKEYNAALKTKMVSDILLIKQAGNSIIVPVLEFVFKEMFKDEAFYNE